MDKDIVEMHTTELTVVVTIEYVIVLGVRARIDRYRGYVIHPRCLNNIFINKFLFLNFMSLSLI